MRDGEPDVDKEGIPKKIVKTVKKVVKKIKEPELSILDKVKADPRYSPDRSTAWFKTKIDALGGNSPTAKYDLLKTTKEHQVTRFLPGCMFIFKYDPKTKEDLPFYDNWPCTLIFSIVGDRAIGINLHYLGYEFRKKLLDKMMMTANRYHNNQQQVLRLNWKLLSNVSKFPEVAPTVHSYLYSHVQSKLIKVDVDEWVIASNLPIESFSKKSFSWVARNSGQIVRKNVAAPKRTKRRVT
jgi:hypothetical protein